MDQGDIMIKYKHSGANAINIKPQTVIASAPEIPTVTEPEEASKEETKKESSKKSSKKKK